MINYKAMLGLYSFHPWQGANVFSISAQPIDAQALAASLCNDSAGAFVAFEGWVRNVNEGRSVLRLEYEAHESLAAKEAAFIIEEAKERYGILGAACVHRVGLLEIGDLAVWVGVSSTHRGEAFEACRYIIDEVKARLPIWKKEHYADGTSEWINCQTCSAQTTQTNHARHAGAHESKQRAHALSLPDRERS
jgi:molybdopterin synthase catalytic subunit